MHDKLNHQGVNMNIQKSLQVALANRGYKTQKAFCDEKLISETVLTRMKKNSRHMQIGTIDLIASELDYSLSEFIKLGE